MMSITLAGTMTILLSILNISNSFLAMNQYHPTFISRIITNNILYATIINNTDNTPNNMNSNLHLSFTNYPQKKMKIRKLANYSIDGTEVEAYHMCLKTRNDVSDHRKIVQVNRKNHTDRNVSIPSIYNHVLNDTLIENMNNIIEVINVLTKKNQQEHTGIDNFATDHDCVTTSSMLNLNIAENCRVLAHTKHNIKMNEDKKRNDNNSFTREDLTKIIQTIQNNANYSSHTNRKNKWKQEMSILKSRIYQLKNSQSTLTLPQSLLRQVLQYNLPNFLLTLDNTLLPIVHSCVTTILGSILPTKIKVNGSVLQQVCTNYIMTGYVIHYIQDVIHWHEVFKIDLYQDELGIISRFHELDLNMDGFLDFKELREVFKTKPKGNIPLQQDMLSCFDYLDDNKDSLISEWEFLRGVKSWCSLDNIKRNIQYGRILYDKKVTTECELTLQGNITIEHHNDTIVEMSIKKYIHQLRNEYNTIQEQLRREYYSILSMKPPQDIPNLFLPDPKWIPPDNIIMNYLSSIQNDVSGVTKLSQDIIDTIQLLNQHLLHGKTGYFKISLSGEMDKKLTSWEPLVVSPDMLMMEMSGIGLQQVCMSSWMMGYGLREEEWNGSYKKMLE